MRIIHNHIKEKRMFNGMTQTDLSVKLKISTAMITRWEQQKFQPSKKYRAVLEKILGKHIFVYNDSKNDQSKD